jgi:hypothetical protein
MLYQSTNIIIEIVGIVLSVSGACILTYLNVTFVTVPDTKNSQFLIIGTKNNTTNK